MGSISDYSENALLNHIFNGAGVAYTPPATVYLGMSTADPGDDAAGLSEPVGNGYIRKAITFGAAAARAITQSGDVNFDQASGAWGDLSHWAVFDAESGNNMLAHGAFAVTKGVVAGNTPVVSSGEVVIEFLTLAGKVDTDSNISNYLANTLLDFMFRNQSFTQPDTYMALCTADIADDDTGTTITEPSNNYARKQVNPNGGSSPTWDLVSSGVVDNTHDIVWPTPSGTWGAITAIAVLDALTLGNLLFYDNDPTNAGQTPDSGDTVQETAGNCDWLLS